MHRIHHGTLSSWSPEGSHIATANAVNGPVTIAAVIAREGWKADISLVGHDLPVEVAVSGGNIVERCSVSDYVSFDLTTFAKTYPATCLRLTFIYWESCRCPRNSTLASSTLLTTRTTATRLSQPLQPPGPWPPYAPWAARTGACPFG